MEFNQQIYRAPSIPKLGRRNVSSSVLSSASKISAASPTPKLKVSRAKFTGRQEPIAEAVVSNAQALAETNLILVEIQKQLSLDFAMRIAEERETIKRMKAAESRRRFGAEEKAVEGTGKLGKGIGKAFNKVISPAKSIFGRIIDFFSIILTGIVFNNAFRWLQDKNNREKVLGVINWVTKHWKELLGVFIGVKVFGFLYKLISFGRFISKLFGGGGRGPGGRGPRGPIGGPMGGCGPTLKCLDKIKGPQLEALADKLAKTKRFSPLFSQSPGSETTSGKTPWWNNALTILGTVIDVASLISLFAPVPGGRPISVLLKALRGLSIFKGLRKGAQAANTARTVTRTVNASSNAAVSKLRQNPVGSIFRAAPSTPSVAKPARSVKKDLPEGFKSRKEVKQYEETGIIDIQSQSKGGPIFGGTSSSVDNIPIMGAKGEYMISNIKNQATTFRPILDDINYNGGKMWEMFSGAIKKLFLITRRQEETTRKFGEVTDRLDKSLQKQKQKAAIKSLTNSGGGSRPNYNLGPTSGGGMTFLPMVLPTKQSAPPTIPTPQAPATEVPFISSMNVADPYRQLTPEIYGIFV